MPTRRWRSDPAPDSLRGVRSVRQAARRSGDPWLLNSPRFLLLATRVVLLTRSRYGAFCPIGLREYPAHADGTFSEFRTGLDYIAFTVPSRDDLEAWQGLLAEKGVTFSPIADSPLGALIALRDPDNIQLELWLPLAQ